VPFGDGSAIGLMRPPRHRRDELAAAVQVNKVYKNAATADPDDTCPLAGAGFELWNADNSAKVRDDILTDANGVACFDHLPLDTDFTFVEPSRRGLRWS
jgi:uncharacterized surface anchored protein